MIHFRYYQGMILMQKSTSHSYAREKFKNLTFEGHLQWKITFFYHHPSINFLKQRWFLIKEFSSSVEGKVVFHQMLSTRLFSIVSKPILIVVVVVDICVVFVKNMLGPKKVWSTSAFREGCPLFSIWE